MPTHPITQTSGDSNQPPSSKATTATPDDDKIARLAESLAALTKDEAMQLGQYMQQRHGYVRFKP